MTTDEIKQNELKVAAIERIKKLRLIDDDFMKAFFMDNEKDVEYILRIIMDRNDLHVYDLKIQEYKKNLYGKSIILDVLATDDKNQKYDIEIQRSDKGAGYKRARYHAALMDSSAIETGEDPEKLPNTYVIFITENDVIGENLPIYFIEKYVNIGNEYKPIDDGLHTVYVNGAKQSGETELEKLMHDFFCTQSKDMYHKQLAEKMHYLKETTEGVNAMCRAIEELVDEFTKKEVLEEKKETVLEMAKDNVPAETIAKYVRISVDEVKAILEPAMV